MSDQTQATEASTLATAVPTTERPSAFAVNIGNLLTKGNPEQSIGEAMNALVTQRVDWENNELASANDGLYALLQHCYSLNNAMSGTGVAATPMWFRTVKFITTSPSFIHWAISSLMVSKMKTTSQGGCCLSIWTNQEFALWKRMSCEWT